MKTGHNYSHKTAMNLMASLCLLASAIPAFADGSITGQIAALLTVGSASGAPGNYDFRVFLVGNPVICNGQSWAFLNVTDSNYNSIVANILSARASGAIITLNWVPVSNYCQIGSVSW
jgi:hypothetical protein